MVLVGTQQDCISKFHHLDNNVGFALQYNLQQYPTIPTIPSKEKTLHPVDIVL